MTSRPRELSLLQFHERVLNQTRRGAYPLLERLKFLAISDSNLDEFLSMQFSLLLGNVEVGDTTLMIVGRFLEHSRVYYFRNGGREEVLVGSADLMERNLGGPRERPGTGRQETSAARYRAPTPA